MLILGMTAWLLRYICLAYGNWKRTSGCCTPHYFTRRLLRLLFVTGYMYTEKKAGEKIKSAAQGLFTFATYGIGMLIGTWFSGFVTDHYTENSVHLWKSIGLSLPELRPLF